MSNGISQVNTSYFIQQFPSKYLPASMRGGMIKILTNQPWSREQGPRPLWAKH